MIGRIGIDLDGVTADFAGTWARKYEEWFAKPVPPSALQGWTGFLDLPEFQDEGKFWNWTDRAGVWRDITPIPGALGGISQLVDAGFALTFITARHEATRKDTAAWLRHHLPVDAQRLELHFTATKWIVPCQVYVDDSPAVLAGLREAGKQTIRYEQPWNKGAKATCSAKDWSQVVKHVRLMFGLDEPDLAEEAGQ